MLRYFSFGWPTLNKRFSFRRSEPLYIHVSSQELDAVVTAQTSVNLEVNRSELLGAVTVPQTKLGFGRWREWDRKLSSAHVFRLPSMEEQLVKEKSNLFMCQHSRLRFGSCNGTEKILMGEE